MRKYIYTAILLFLCCNGFAQFTAGNLALLVADASANNTTCSVVEINKTAAGQSAASTVVISSTGSNAIRLSGSATSTGYVANSNDGTLLCFTGVNTTNTSANINTLNPRAVVTLNAAQAVNIATTYTGGSGDQTRSATTLNNANWYIGDQGGMFTNGTTAGSPTGNFRAVKTFGGAVYTSSASSTASVIQVGTLAATTGATYTGLSGLSNNASLQDFYLVSSGSNGSAYDVLYVLSATSNTAGTINKYSLVGTTWTANGSYTTSFGGFGLAAQKNGSGAYLFVSTGQGALTGNSVIRLTDAAGYNTSIAITTANNVTLYTTTSLKIIKGLAFAPAVAVSPAVTPNPVSLTFPNTAAGTNSAAQTVSFTAANLTPASGSLTATAPNTNFQVSNDGTTWGSSTTIAYSGSGTTTGSLQVRFSPQTTGAASGNVSITGGGLAAAATISVSGTGTNSLSLAFSTATTTALNPPYVSGTINDAGDPAQQQGIVIDVKNSGTAIAATDYSLSAASSNTTVVPNANIGITPADGQATVKIAAASAGYADITLTLTTSAGNTTLVIHYAASVSASTSAGTHWHTGFGDASGAIPLDDNYMIVCNDEVNSLYVYPRDRSGLPLVTFDYNQGNILNLTDGSAGAWKEVDAESGTASITTPGKSYWLGSMSNSSSFNTKPNRNRLFAITTTGTGAAATFANAGSYSNLKQQLLTWGDANGYNFTASAADGHDSKVIDGFNIEGMVFGPDNTSMYIGFRAPLVPVANRTKAVIAPIQNFEAWFNNGAPAGNPTIGAPIELDLGGRGIRDIIRLSNGNYIIAAGRYDGTLNPAVYLWTGFTGSAPVQLTTFDVSTLNIEGVLQVNQGGNIALDKLQFISDDGSNVYYGDGIETKDLTQDNFKKFSSDIITSTGIVLPIDFIYFTAARQSDAALLKWQVAPGSTTRSFDVYRSANGRDFTLVTTLPAVANQADYTYMDNNIAATKLYYRIQANESTNRQYWSAVRTVDITGANTAVQVYPNPVSNGQFSITVNKPGKKTVQVYTTSGTLYQSFNFTETAKDISTGTWGKGYYILRITTADGTVTVQKIAVL